MDLNECPKCKCKKLYLLKNDYLKCKNCHKKFSQIKIKNDLLIMNYFCNNYNALDVSNIMGLNYRSIQNRYSTFRLLCANYLEGLYQNSIQEHSSYEEYYYFTKRDKLKKRKTIYDAINIIGFYSNNRVYTLLMPNLPKPTNTPEDKSFEKYLHWHKLYSHEGYVSPLKEFWSFFENQMTKYRGVSKENFFYYLKESEFKYNFSKIEQENILKEIYL